MPFKKGPGSMANRGEYLDRLFNSFVNEDIFAPLTVLATGQGTFKVDIKENDEAYIFEADMPGIEKEAIDVDYENEHLTISTKREDTVEENTGTYIRRERHYGEMKRSFFVGDIDRERIKAGFTNGVLTVEVPKTGAAAEKKKIDIT